MDKAAPAGPVEQLGRALSALRQSLEAWAAQLDKAGCFEYQGLKRSWDDLFARTRAVEQFAAELDRSQSALDRDLNFLLSDVGHLRSAWTSGLEHLGGLIPESPAAAALRACVARAKDLQAAVDSPVPLHPRWLETVARLTALIEEAILALKEPLAPILNERAKAELRETEAKAEAERQAGAAELAKARDEALRLRDELEKSARRVAELESQQAALSKQLLAASQTGRKASETAAKVELIQKEAAQKVRGLEAALAKTGRQAAELQDQLTQANAKIAKLTHEMEASLRPG